MGFGRAAGRYFATILSGMIIYIGYIMAAVTSKKQALHDMIAER
ncbi:RDD family protein [Peribacillus sp. SIMBA_075]